MRILYVCLALLVCLLLSSNLSAQSIEYEELSQIPLTDVDYVTVAPYGAIFMLSQGNLYRSTDEGVDWTRLADFPQGFQLREIDFFADGTAVFTNSLDVQNDKQNLVFREGGLKGLIPNSLGEGTVKIIGNTLYYYRSDSIFVSSNKGAFFDSYEYRDKSDVVVDMHSYNGKIFLYTYDIDTITQDRLYAIKEYDRNFNFVESRLLPNDTLLINPTMLAYGKHMVFRKTYSDIMLLTSDGGQSFLRKEINQSPSFNVGIYNDTYYYEKSDSIYALKLSGDFLNNFSTLFNVKYDLEGLAFVGKNIIYIGDHYFRFENIDSGRKIDSYEFPFQNSQISKLRIDKEGNIYASSKSRTQPSSLNLPGCFVFKSSDDGKSWQQFYGSYYSQLYSWSLSDHGGLTIGNDEYYTSDSSALYVSSEGVVETWFDNLHRPEVYSLENGDYRIFIAGFDGCFDLAPGIGVSTFNEDFKFVSFRAWDCLPINMEVTIYNDKIYLFGGIPTDLGIYYHTELPMQQFSNTLEEVELPLSMRFGSSYYSIINSDGEIYVYPGNKLLSNNTVYDGNFGDILYPVYYSADVEAGDIREVGKAPLGQLIETDSRDRAFIIQSDGSHFVRSNYAIDYSKVEVIDQSFDKFVDGDFDSQNRLVIAVEDGRVLRAVTDGITTSTANVEHADFTLSPNPSSEVLHISISDGENSTITISDISGRILSVSQHQKLKFNIDIAELTNGIYFLTVHNESVSKGTRKFVKM